VKKCGNSIVDTASGEVCDNGANGADGCSDDCKTVQDGWNCNQIDGKSGRCTPICGDGKLVGYETRTGYCDDANTNNEDGCKYCFISPLYSCTGAPSVCVKLCGNKRWNVIAGEDCDNGLSTNNDDGCDDNDCTIQDGWYCEHVEFGPSTCTT
jgi:cysteine-rich repeat protein